VPTSVACGSIVCGCGKEIKSEPSTVTNHMKDCSQPMKRASPRTFGDLFAELSMVSLVRHQLSRSNVAALPPKKRARSAWPMSAGASLDTQP
jgi:hypothetical protein